MLLAEKGIESAGGVIDSSVHKQMAVELADVIQEIYQVTLSSGDICDIGNYLKIGRASCRERVCQYV